MSTLGSTPSQTVGPFLGIVFPWADGPYVVPEGTAGGCWIRGTVYDGAGDIVPDAVVETWQADAGGRFNHPDDPRGAVASECRGFGRSQTAPDGGFAIFTVKPGAVPGDDGADQAPHIDVSLFARGLLHRVVTRIYFGDEAAANDADAVLGTVPSDRRETLVARPSGDGYRFDIHLQGPAETAFFDV